MGSSDSDNLGLNGLQCTLLGLSQTLSDRGAGVCYGYFGGRRFSSISDEVLAEAPNQVIEPLQCGSSMVSNVAHLLVGLRSRRHAAMISGRKAEVLCACLETALYLPRCSRFLSSLCLPRKNLQPRSFLAKCYSEIRSVPTRRFPRTAPNWDIWRPSMAF